LAAENRKSFWAAVALACWTGAVAVVLWAVPFLAYVVCIAGQPGTLASCSGAVSLGAILPLAMVAFLFGGIPWLVFIGVVRTLRWWRSQMADDREHSQ